jgi:protein mago nashi
MTESLQNDDFYVRYFVGHKGRFGKEFLEFELDPSGKLRYANSSSRDELIRKEVFVSPAVVEEFKRIVESSEITRVDDSQWKEPDEMSRQELECKIGSHHIAFTACEIGSMADIQKSPDPEGLQVFFYLALDLKALVMALISCHFKSRPIPD